MPRPILFGTDYFCQSRKKWLVKLKDDLGSVFELDILPNRDNDRNWRAAGKGQARQAKHTVAAVG